MIEVNMDELSLAKLVPAIFGAMVSIKFVQGSPYEVGSMVTGGVALSYYGGDWIATYISMPERLVGFLVGLFGMVIVNKVYEVIKLIDAKQVATDAWAWAKRKWGA